jgi:hypothetical protein
LKPLGLSRGDTWLCDLVPRSCSNSAQRKANRNKYLPIADEYGLPRPTISAVPTILTDTERRRAIWNEIEESGAGTLILLGDKPIQWFLKYFDPRWELLSDFMKDGEPYGKLCKAQIKGKQMNVLPLAHPRQIARLGTSSPEWHERHQKWMSEDAGMVFKSWAVDWNHAVS